MVSDLRPARPGGTPLSQLRLVLLVGLAAAVLFRLDVLPGGLVGWDLLFAVAGWALAKTVRSTATARAVAARSIAVVWPAAVAAVVASVAWVLTVAATRWDATVRGEAFGLFGGYENWHLLSRGPLEAVDPSTTPLQGLWPVAVLAQVGLAWALLFAATRGRAARRVGRTDPMLAVTLIAFVGLVAWGFVVVIGGASGQRATVGTDLRAIAFIGGSAAAFVSSSGFGPSLAQLCRAVLPLTAASLVAVAVFASPSSALWRDGGAVLAPMVAVLVVTALLSPQARPLPTGGPVGTLLRGVERTWSALGGDALAVFVSFALLHGPIIALGVGDRTGATAWLGRIVGLAAALGASLLVVRLAGRRSDEPSARERRRVLVPPAIVAVVVVLMSVTGAFRWSGPHPIDPKPAVTASTGG